MGSMALQLKPWTVPDASDVFAKALTLRDLADQSRYRQLQQQSLQLKLEQEREEMQQARSLQRLFRTNPKPTPDQVMQAAPGPLGMRFMTEYRQRETAEQTAKKAKAEFVQFQRKLARNKAKSILVEPDEERRKTLWGIHVPELIDLEMLRPEMRDQPLDENLVRQFYIDTGDEKEYQDAINARIEAANKAAAEKRAQEKHIEEVTIKAPLEREKLTADVELAKRKLQGNEPATGTLREFKDVFYPGYLAAKGIKNPTARDEYNAYVDFRELLRARIGGVPGVDVPKSQAVVDQEIAVAKAKRPTIGDLTPGQSTQVQSIAKAFDNTPIVKNFNEVATKQQTMKGILDQPRLGGPGDLAFVYEFMKALDPTSVVRETEYANAAKSGNIFSGAWARFNGYLKPEGGFLPPEVKKGFMQLINQKLDVSKRQVQGLYKDYGRRIEKITGQPGGAGYMTYYPGVLEEEPEGKGSSKPGDLSGVSTEELLKRLQGK